MHPEDVSEVGSLNMRGCKSELRLCEIGELKCVRNVDVLPLWERKRKGKGETFLGNKLGYGSEAGKRARAR